MGDALWLLVGTSATVLGPGLGLLATVTTLGAVPVSWLRGRRIASVAFLVAAVAFTPGLVMMGPLAPDLAPWIADHFFGPPPVCGPEMCGTACSFVHEAWLRPARDLVWTAVTASDGLATLCMALGLGLARR